MSHLAINLFGGFQVELDGETLTAFRTTKNRALLAYLALESGRSHRRESLAALLWPNSSEVEARNSLRQALYQLNQLIPPRPETEPHLLITNDQLRFNPASDHWIDVAEFKSRLSACQSHHPAGLSLCVDCLKSLQRAMELYQGDMLDGFTLPRCTRFTDWQILTQETYHRQALASLTLLANYYETNLDFEKVIAYTQKEIDLEPWHESAYRQQMWALAMSGRPEEALWVYTTIREVLQRELGIPPMDETRRLFDQIRSRDLHCNYPAQGDPGWPFTPADHPLKKTTADSFVGRQLELDQLFRYLGDSLAGHGHVAFLSGEAGSGKTALLHQFACRALEAHGDLLVSGGTCSAYSGLGDPYQPFREVLKTLAGINDLACPGAILSSEPTMRLFAALPVILQTLLQTSPDLVGTMIPTREFLQHARTANRLDTTMYTQLEALAMQLDPGRFVAALPDSQKVPTNYETNSLVQTCLFDQVSRMLLRLSQRFPLLIILDDLQWCDNASASLLFYLGSHLPAGRILLIGAYRPEDMISTGDGYRHPMIPVINEFQRRFGEIQIDLSLADGWAFVNSYLDHEPNHFDQEFRKSFYLHTRGNALFIVELLDAMKERGEVTQDSGGYWISNPYVDWECLPPRVEAVIAERLSRLDYECLTLLEAACLQGEAFRPSALADVLGFTEGQIIAKLSGSLSRQHRLVSSLSSVQHDGSCQASYQFRHILFQKYLYQSLDGVERARLKKATIESLERYATNN